MFYLFGGAIDMKLWIYYRITTFDVYPTYFERRKGDVFSA